MDTLSHRFFSLIVLACLVMTSLACNLTKQAEPTPTATLIVLGSPSPVTTGLLLPTATPGPSHTPLGGQFDPTFTPPPSPTPIPLPTLVPPTASPVPTGTETPDVASTGPLEMSLEIHGRRLLEDGRVTWTITVHAVGGNGAYTYEHLGAVQPGPTFDTVGTQGNAIVHEVIVRSGDGQQASCNYYIPGDATGDIYDSCDD